MAATERDVHDQTAETARIVRAYFEEVEAGRADAALRHYGPRGSGAIHGQMEGGRQEIADHFAMLHAAFPDFDLEVLQLIAQDDMAAVRWRLRATFAGPGDFMGFAPTGARVDIEGTDFLKVADGKILRLDAYTDGMTVARQLGLLPEQGSRQDRGMQRALNARTRLGRRMAGRGPEQIAEGVWIVRGGFPLKTMNVYLVRDGDGVLVFDAGIEAMTGAIAAAGAQLGGITKVVLGHGHPDHRGAAPGLGVPVWCHADDKADAESDGGMHYVDFSKLDFPARYVMPRMLKMWDGGPVEIDRTVEEGDEIAGFRVVHLPCHAPGLIGLWRDVDRLALTSDCFYTLDPQTGRKGGPRLPHAAFNVDGEQARASIRKLAAMAPAAAWPGHADPLTGDVAA
jgi:hydroxyacylglutathione hydrolase